MSYEELDRVGVIERVIEKRLTQREAARMLGLTSRQVRRLRRAYEQDGVRALASKHRGRPSNRRLPCELRREALATVRSQYEGFGPTLAHEKLTELHDLRLSAETLRHWMIEDGLWVPRARREPRIQQLRMRSVHHAAPGHSETVSPSRLIPSRTKRLARAHIVPCTTALRSLSRRHAKQNGGTDLAPISSREGSAISHVTNDLWRIASDPGLLFGLFSRDLPGRGVGPRGGGW